MTAYLEEEKEPREQATEEIADKVTTDLTEHPHDDLLDGLFGALWQAYDNNDTAAWRRIIGEITEYMRIETEKGYKNSVLVKFFVDAAIRAQQDQTQEKQKEFEKKAKKDIEKAIRTLPWPLDKAQNDRRANIWHVDTDAWEQLFNVGTAKTPMGLYVSLEGGKQPLTSYDKILYYIICGIYRDKGDETLQITDREIAHAIGADNPSSDQLQRIRRSVENMAARRIVLDNVNEHPERANETKSNIENKIPAGKPIKGKRKKAYPVTIHDYLLNAKSLENSKIGVYIIHTPALISYGNPVNISRDMITPPPGVQLTDDHARIIDYLITRIMHMRNAKDKTPHKILFNTFYKEIYIEPGSDQRMKQARAIDTADKILKYWTDKGVITEYSVDNENGYFLITPENRKLLSDNTSPEAEKE